MEVDHISVVRKKYHDKLDYIISLAAKVRRGKKIEVCDSIITIDWVKHLLDWEMGGLKWEMEHMDVSEKPEDRPNEEKVKE